MDTLDPDFGQNIDSLYHNEKFIVEVVEFLQPFKQYIDLLSTEMRPSMHLVTLFLEETQTRCNDVINNKTGPIVNLATCMLKAMKMKALQVVMNPRKEKKSAAKKRKRMEYLVSRRLSAADIDFDETLFETPRNDVDKTIRNEIKKEVTREKRALKMNEDLNLIIEETSPEKERNDMTANDTTSTPTELPKFSDVMDDIVTRDGTVQVEMKAEDIATKELNDYKSNLISIVGKSKKMKKVYLHDPFKYHSSYSSLHPRLSKVAIRYLSRPATSAKP